jgi:DNA-directed RNA polymerase specialized sigma24 family protein
MMAHPDLELIERVLARDRAAGRAFVDKLSPVIQSRVNAVLLRRGRANRQDSFDLTQEIFKILLEDDAKVLRSWAPQKGASISTFVSLVAERRAVSILASGRKSGTREDPEDTAAREDLDQGPTPELRTISRDLLERMLDELRLRLSDKGYEMFHYLFVEEREVADVCELTGLSSDAVYTWRSRLLRTIRAAEAALMSDSPPASGKEEGGRA